MPSRHWRARAEALKATGVEPSGRLWVPGRIEVLGKHTDYAGGRSLTCAVERGFAVAFTPRSSPEVRIVDAHDGRQAQFRSRRQPDAAGRRVDQLPDDGGPPARPQLPGLATGADIAFYSNLPRAAGLSTSSALITAVYLVLDVGQRSAGPPGVSAGAALGRRRRGLPRAASRTDRPSAPLPATRASARSAAARTTRRFSSAPRACSAAIATAR